MRVVKEIKHASCLITVFNWNSKYLIKLEQGDIEQTFKVDETEVIDESDIDQILNEVFLSQALNRFRDMNKSLAIAMNEL